jgi:hypothetical protein
MFRTLTILAVLGALGWSGYWAVGRAALLRGTEAAVAEARAEGWTVDWADLSVSGYPNRFDTWVEGFSARGPGGAWGVEAPRLGVLALSYRPNEVIVVPMTPLTVRTPAGPVSIAAADLRASAAFTVANPPEPLRATVVAEALEASGAGAEITVASGQAAMREAEEAENAYDLALTLTDLTVPGLPAPLPQAFGTVALDATARFDAPLAEEPALTELTLRRASVDWGEAALDLTGAVSVGPGGTPEGDLVLAIENWEAVAPLLAQAGVPPLQVALLSGGIAELEQDGRAEIPLTLSGGFLRFGAIPLAPLPRLSAPYSP